MGSVTNISTEDLEVRCLRRTIKAGETVEDVAEELIDSAKQLWAHALWLINGKPQEVPVAIVGEAGPELVDLPAGSVVPPLDPTKVTE